MKYILFTLTLVLLLQSTPSQYHINRVNPFKQLSETLQSHQAEGCDGSVLNLKCPGGTKVRKFTLRFNLILIDLQISIQSVHYGSSKTKTHCSAFLSTPDQTSSCAAKTSLRRVEAECQGRSECALSVSPQNLIAEGDDPCPYLR